MTTRHVRPNDEPEGGWVVTPADSDAVEAHTTTQAGAVERGRDLLLQAGGGTLVVHNTDGSVRDERSVG